VRLTVASVGKPRDRHMQAMVDDYANRIRRHWKLDLIQVREGTGTTDAVKAAESDALRRVIAPRSTVILLDERGDMPTSADLATRIDRAMNQSQADWTLLIGGANGHAPGMREQANWVWSLSRLTLPHDLALVLLLEQLYRAGSILRGEPYHRA
jgi:23S rRNA (pseudouridine1915-N3)-methyltransferase